MNKMKIGYIALDRKTIVSHVNSISILDRKVREEEPYSGIDEGVDCRISRSCRHYIPDIENRCLNYENCCFHESEEVRGEK